MTFSYPYRPHDGDTIHVSAETLKIVKALMHGMYA